VVLLNREPGQELRCALEAMLEYSSFAIVYVSKLLNKFLTIGNIKGSGSLFKGHLMHEAIAGQSCLFFTSSCLERVRQMRMSGQPYNAKWILL
jgi:hypothetical protein